ncbi:MAG: ethanolamine ammonia-lyase subunit EutC [Pseudomonadota bacterium]
MSEPRDGAQKRAWQHLSTLTPARIALGRCGTGLPTRHVLDFAMAHALARDSVHAAFDAAALVGAVEGMGLHARRVTSAATSREVYLRRPDLGRRLSEAGRASLLAVARGATDLVIVVGDGLSATAVHHHAPPLLEALCPLLRERGIGLGPVVIASGARVALGDDVGEALDAGLVLVLIGERPGLSAPDSLGAYLTHTPRVGRRDAERNCVSNIRDGGLSPAAAAARLAWLIEAARARGLTGVALKDESDAQLERKAGPVLR